MPDVFEKDIEVVNSQSTAEEQNVIKKLFELVEAKANPWKLAHNEIVKENYNFCELRQWDGADMQLLALADVPTLAIDRINRGLDYINGVRANTGNTMKIVKREQGDDRVASLLQACAEYAEYCGDFQKPRDEAFDSMAKTGMGLRVLGYDPTARGGIGELWCENFPVEDCGWSKTASKELDDISWWWRRTVQSWEDAMADNPEKAGILKGMKTVLASEWEKIKGGSTTGSLVQDYGALVTSGDPSLSYQDQVDKYEFWLRRRIPVRKIGSIQFIPLPDGNVMPVPQVREEAVDYKPQELEQDLGVSVNETWEQFIVASAGNMQNATLLKQSVSKYPFSPLVGMCAAMKKSGQPFSYVEMVIPHQKRINIAWAQKTTFNNKAIKAPLAIKNLDPAMIDSKILNSQLGTILAIGPNEDVINVNITPNVDLQAIEEGQSAREDMDFAAASTEPVLRGQSGSQDSGIKLSMQQNAAVTPLNKWVKAEKLSELAFWRKALHIIIAEFSPERMQRIVGDENFFKIVIGKIDPVKGIPLQPPLQLPLNVDVAHYDVEITDSALSDFNKQQSFNAVESLVSLNVPFTDSYRIQNAPIKDVDSAIASNEEARNDIIRQQQMIIEGLQSQLEMTQKLIPTESKVAMGQAGAKMKKSSNQKKNAQTGASQSQAGMRSMVGGQNFG